MRLILCLLALMVPSLALAQQTVTYVDDLGRTVEIPADPQRIAALDDLRLTVPLLELGVVPVASHGRPSDSGPYIRGAKLATGIDFDNSEIAFVGNEIDAEAVLLAAPDLIVVYGQRADQLAQFEGIAPTVVLDADVGGDYLDIYGKLAELTNTQDRLDRLQTRYETQLAQLKSLVDTQAITVSVVLADGGNLVVPHTFGSLGVALRDAGFAFPEIVDTIAPGAEIRLSAERLDAVDADLIIDSYRSDRGEGPDAADARMRDVFERYCDMLWACRNGQYVRLPREEFYAISYYGLTASIYTLTALVSGRELVLRDAQ